MRKLLLAAALLVLPMSVPAAAQQTIVEVKKSESCGCCNAWIGKLKGTEFKVKAQNLAMGTLMKFKLDNGISAKHASCHTAKIGNYIIEGHVPLREIRRLLREKPDAVGLSVPGMVVGSPGMEVGTKVVAYDVLLIKKDGTSSVYASYQARK